MFSLYNSTTLVNSTSYTDATRSINFTNLPDGTYYYNVTVNDTVNNENSTSTRTFTVDTTNPLVDFIDSTAVDNANLSQTYIYVNLSLTEINFANITYTLTNASGTVNETTYTTSVTEINWTSLSEGNYTYYANVTDFVNNKNSTSARNATLDTTNPNVTLFPTGMPDNNSIGGESTFFNWSAYDNMDGNLSCYPLQGTTEFNLTYTQNNTINNATEILEGGQYNLKVRCYDDANNSQDSSDSILYLVAEINITEPLLDNTTYRTDDATTFNVVELSGNSYLTNTTVEIINESNIIARTLNLVEMTTDNWSYGYTWLTWEPQYMTVKGVAFNNTIGSAINVTTTRAVTLLRALGNTSSPTINMSCPNRTFIVNGTTANIQIVTDLDTLLYNRNVTITDPNSNVHTLNSPDNNTKSTTGFVYRTNYTFNINQTGNYTLTTNITDFENQSVTDTYIFTSVDGFDIRSINTSLITNLTVQDQCDQQEISKAQDHIIEVPTGAYYDINTSVVDTLHNLTILFKRVYITENITEGVAYRELANEIDAPTDERKVALFELNTTLNFTNYTLNYDYTAIAHTVNDETTLKIWKCENITTCSLVNTDAAVNTTTNIVTINLTSMSFFMITEEGVASEIVETPTSSGGGGGGGGGIIYRSLNIITPGPLELGLADEVIVPITIENTEKITLSAIKLSAHPNTPDIDAEFDITEINFLKSGESRKTFLTLTSHSIPGEYDVDIYANVSSPKFNEKAKLYIKLVGTVGEKFIVERVVFAQDLFKENPVCLELNDLLIKADNVMKEGRLTEGKELVQQAIYQCKDLIAAEQVPFNIVNPSEWKMPILVILGLVVLALLTVIAIRKPKLNLFRAKKERKKLFKSKKFRKKTIRKRLIKHSKNVWN